jgi:response regulator of citrate/malate metabolism
MIEVVVVDDDFRVAAIHAAYVEKVAGFRVVGEAHSAGALFEVLERRAADLVLLDLYLPDLHGLEVLKRLRLRTRGTVGVDVLVVSAAQDVASVRTAMQCGAVHYLLKPFGFPSLRDKLLSYQALRRQLDGVREASQSSIDRLYASRAGGVGGGDVQTSPTLDAVADILCAAEGDLSAADVASRLGASRATAQRYLTRLEALGRAEMSPRYGAAGRPEHRYRWSGAPRARIPPAQSGAPSAR